MFRLQIVICHAFFLKKNVVLRKNKGDLKKKKLVLLGEHYPEQ